MNDNTRPYYPPAPGEPNDRPRYPAANTMNPALGKYFEGLDVDGRPVSGVVWHAGKYDKQGHPVTWVLLLGDLSTAVISAQALSDHLDGLALCESMERDRE